ncbi:CaiB/BaiF CoA transferase family protein [Candidatus Poriferisodalis sp.]|uniref:CaiB/BaiF CoA transferase family protein n=1 Tax=Candidatus Poriferisodalis sp. TaxID=3101277 RepID=UPI003B01C70E
MTSGIDSVESSRQAASPLPLADIIVLDLTIARAGPTAVRQLADWGADVIRVDAPDDGFEEGRQASPDYLNIHRNKRSLVIDLKHPQGRDLLHTLARSADVLVENLRPTVKYRLGFDWDTLRAVNPALVMASISGFGQDGPYATRGGVDQIAQGLGGMMAVTGLPGQGPVRAGVAISDVTAGLQLAIGILVALHERSRTGQGRWVHTSLLESMIGMLDFQAARWTVAGEDPQQAGNDHPTMVPMGTYVAADGYINIAAPGGRLLRSFCAEIGLPGLTDDERFSSSRTRSANRAALNEIIGERLATASCDEWVERLNAVGIPCGRVNSVAEAFADPQVRHLGMAAPVRHPAVGDIRIIRNATQIDGVPGDIRRPSPTKGEHTDEILAQFGLDADDVAVLRDSGAVR